jgi:hypothetical protein
MTERDEFDLICKNCGLTWGSHRGDPKNATCPGHEGHMDWDKGPGTVFEPTMEHRKVERGTLARNLV